MDAMIAKAPVDPETVVEDVEHLSLSPFGPARASITEHPLSEEEVKKMTDYFHASLYMCLGMIYLRRNPLLRDPLTLDVSSSTQSMPRAKADIYLSTLACEEAVTRTLGIRCWPEFHVHPHGM